MSVNIDNLSDTVQEELSVADAFPDEENASSESGGEKQALEELRAEAEQTGVLPEGVMFDSSQAETSDIPLRMYKGAEAGGEDTPTSDGPDATVPGEITDLNDGSIEASVDDVLSAASGEEGLTQEPGLPDESALIDPIPEELVDPMVLESKTELVGPNPTLYRLMAGTPVPEGDANGDGVVDERDIIEESSAGSEVLNPVQAGEGTPVNETDWSAWNAAGGIDLNKDGAVDEADKRLYDEKGGWASEDGSTSTGSADDGEEKPTTDWTAWNDRGGIDMNGDGSVDGDDKILYDNSGGWTEVAKDDSGNTTDGAPGDIIGRPLNIDFNGDGVIDDGERELAMRIRTLTPGEGGDKTDPDTGVVPPDTLPSDLQDWNGDGVIDGKDLDMVSTGAPTGTDDEGTPLPGGPIVSDTNGDGVIDENDHVIYYSTGNPVPENPGDPETLPSDLQDWNGDGVIDGKDLDMVTTTGASGGMNGDDLANILKGKGLGDLINGNGGDDKLLGMGGDDKLYGGAGNDFVSGGVGKDLLCGGDGNDDLRGGQGADSFLADLGDDILRGGAGRDLLDFDGVKSAVKIDLRYRTAESSESGKDSLLSIENAKGGLGDDLIHGNTVANTLGGGGGDDRLWGHGGEDSLFGGSGKDVLSGGLGDDWLRGGVGRDLLNGGEGHDTFEFSSLRDSTKEASDLIRDFTKGDIIDLSDLKFKGISDFTISHQDGFTNLEANGVDFGLKLLGHIDLTDSDFNWS